MVFFVDIISIGLFQRFHINVANNNIPYPNLILIDILVLIDQFISSKISSESSLPYDIFLSANCSIKARSHGAAATAFFFAATIGLHCNKWSHSHCAAATVAAAMVPQGAASEWVPTPFYAAAAVAKHFKVRSHRAAAAAIFCHNKWVA